LDATACDIKAAPDWLVMRICAGTVRTNLHHQPENGLLAGKSRQSRRPDQFFSAKKSGPEWPYATEMRVNADQLLGSLVAKEAGEPDESRFGSERDLLK
jgi:hypothetical protein